MDEITFKKDITPPGLDGIKYIFDVKDKEVEVGISGTAMAIDNFGDEDIIDRLKHFIQLSLDVKEEDIEIVNIEITSNFKSMGWKVKVSGRRNFEFSVEKIK